MALDYFNRSRKTNEDLANRLEMDPFQNMATQEKRNENSRMETRYFVFSQANKNVERRNAHTLDTDSLTTQKKRKKNEESNELTTH